MSRTSRIAVATISALLLLGFGVQGVVAAPGDGFNCNGCIDRKDVGPKAVASSEILNGSIAAVDLGKDAVLSGKIKNGAVMVHDIADSALASVGSLMIVGATTAAEPETIAHVSVMPPGPGTLLLLLEGNVLVDAPATGVAANVGTGILGICSTAGASDMCGDSWQPVQSQDADATDDPNALASYSTSRMMMTDGSAVDVFINAEATDADGLSFLGTAGGELRLAAFFFPATLPMEIIPPPEEEG